MARGDFPLLGTMSSPLKGVILKSEYAGPLRGTGKGTVGLNSKNPPSIMLTKLRVIIFILCALPAVPTIVRAQVSTPAPSAQPVTSDADRQWQDLEYVTRPISNAELLAGKSGPELVAARTEAVANYVTRADLLKKFYTDNPQAPQVTEAKRLEAMNLVYAVQAGDNAREGRWQRLIAELRDNKELPVKDRCLMATIADHLTISRKTGLSHSERLAAYEISAQGLVAEFPTEPAGYEALLGVARTATATKGVELTRQLLGMPAPITVKLQARILVDRYALVGKDLAGILRDAGSSVIPDKGSPTIIYAWASWSEGSQVLAGDLKTKAGAAKIIGLCLDANVTAAKASATKHALPGELIYDDRGLDGAVAQALKLTDAGWIYVADRTGKIRSVRAQEDSTQFENL
jgi:hypothetical protein